LNNKYLTASDYTIQIKNIPTKNLEEEEFLSFIKSLYKYRGGVGGGGAEIARATFVHDIKDFSTEVRELQGLRKKKGLIERYRKSLKEKHAAEGITITKEQLEDVYPPSANFCRCCCQSTTFPSNFLI
jgi:hypothetical protein